MRGEYVLAARGRVRVRSSINPELPTGDIEIEVEAVSYTHLDVYKRQARNMNSLAGYSRSNAINREWIEMYLNEAHSQGLRSVRCHCCLLYTSRCV